MANQPSFKDVLRQVIADDYAGALLKDPGHDRWNKKLHGFCKRWLNSQTDNGLWEKIAGDVKWTSREACFRRIITCAIWELFKLDLTPPETFSPQALRSEREKLLKLAQSAETLANYYREGESEDDKTAALRYEQEAKRFRLRLADMEPPRSGRYQSRGRKFTREQLSFMQSLARNLQGHFGKPYREAVGVITNIAYPQVRATSDDVRKACDARPDPAEIVRHEVALELAGKLDFE